MRGLLDGFILQSFLEATDPGTGQPFLFDEWVGQMAHAPQVQVRARRKVARVMGERAPELAGLKAMPRTRNVFRETLRLFPPVGFMAAPLPPERGGGQRATAGGRRDKCAQGTVSHLQKIHFNY